MLKSTAVARFKLHRGLKVKYSVTGNKNIPPTVSYGDGHSTSYFRRVGAKEAEYLAHAFENAFLGNRVFQKYMPEIYEEMIAYIKTLK